MKFDFTDQIKQKTDQELNDIFINAKDYNPDFVQLAEAEMLKRNMNIDESKKVKEKVAELDMKQIEEGKPGSPLYIFFCFVLAIFGGIIAIYAGYIYSQSTMKTDDGREFYVYNDDTRVLGKILMGVGSAVILYYVLRMTS